MKKITLIIAGILIIGGGSFYAGTKYDQNKILAARSASGLANFSGLRQIGAGGQTAGQRGVRASGGLVSGEVVSKDDKSITVKLQDGGSKIVFFTPSTPITKSVSGVSQDISPGQQVIVTGTANSDGSVNAQSIQLRQSLPPQTQQSQVQNQ